MATDQLLLTSWATPPLMSANMIISPVSWIVSIETGSCSQAPLMATDQPLLTSWATPPLISANMIISPVSWIVSIETDPRAGGAFPPGTSP